MRAEAELVSASLRQGLAEASAGSAPARPERSLATVEPRGQRARSGVWLGGLGERGDAPPQRRELGARRPSLWADRALAEKCATAERACRIDVAPTSIIEERAAPLALIAGERQASRSRRRPRIELAAHKLPLV